VTGAGGCDEVLLGHELVSGGVCGSWRATVDAGRDSRTGGRPASTRRGADAAGDDDDDLIGAATGGGVFGDSATTASVSSTGRSGVAAGVVAGSVDELAATEAGT